MQAQIRRATLEDCPTCGIVHERKKPLLNDVLNLEPVPVPVTWRTWIAAALICTSLAISMLAARAVSHLAESKGIPLGLIF